MKNIRKEKERAIKEVEVRKDIINEKAIPKGDYCCSVKSDSVRNVYRQYWGDGYVGTTCKVKVCPYYEMYEADFMQEHCKLLNVGILNGMKSCHY